MNDRLVCCQHLNSLVPCPSPFLQIALGFYDGPTSGLLKCAACGEAFQFDMLDWDDDHHVRVFRLARLPSGAFERAVATLERAEMPSWPLWVPFARAQPKKAELRDEIDRQLQETLGLSAPADRIIAWCDYGEKILAARKMPVRDLADVVDWFSREPDSPHRNWFEAVGLSKVKAC